jgi:hypothetical protein
MTPDTDPVAATTAEFLAALSQPGEHVQEMDLPAELLEDGAA